jgi:NADH-quinone oxidoreductase subunit A
MCGLVTGYRRLLENKPTIPRFRLGSHGPVLDHVEVIFLADRQAVSGVGVGNLDFHLADYFPIFLYLAAILIFVCGVMAATHLIGPRKKTPVKLMPYESGMDPIGGARQRFDVKYYLIAILFLVFDVELLFLYPWAVSVYLSGDETLIPGELQSAIFAEVLVFLATLAIAYVYAWRKGVFEWR